VIFKLIKHLTLDILILKVMLLNYIKLVY